MSFIGISNDTVGGFEMTTHRTEPEARRSHSDYAEDMGWGFISLPDDELGNQRGIFLDSDGETTRGTWNVYPSNREDI